MATLTEFFWKIGQAKKETYLYHLPTMGNALEMARALQAVSSADVTQIDFSLSGVCLPSGTGRRFEFEIAPSTTKPTLTAYKRPGDGAGLGTFFVVYLSGYPTRLALSAPSPRLNLLADKSAMQTMAEEWCRTFKNASKISGLSVSGVRIIAPKHYQKAFDGLVWYQKK